MANTAYVGAGTTLGTSYYMRRFYAANADARTTTSRSNLSNSTLTGADSHALRRAIRSLGSFTYDDDNETNIKNNVSAFISTYNNMINSSGASDDRTMKNTQKSLKNLTAEYESQLDKIGITVKDNGTLESRSSLFSSADISKFESLFSSDSEYMQRVNSYARRLENRSNILTQIEYNDALAKRNANKQTSSSVSDSTTGKTDSADTGSTAVNALNIASVTPVTADLNTLLQHRNRQQCECHFIIWGNLFPLHIYFQRISTDTDVRITSADKRHHRWDMSDIRIHNDRYLIPGKQVCNRMVLV